MDHLAPLEAQLLELVAEIEPDLPRQTVLSAARAAATKRSKLLHLVQALSAGTDLLTCGRPAGPIAVDQFAHALLAVGASHVIAPRCRDCGHARALTARSEGTRICESCRQKRRITTGSCANCASVRRLAYRDRQGRRVCHGCRPDRGVDPVARLLEQLRDLEPDMDRAVMAAAITRVSKIPRHLLNLAWELEDRPTLLTGDAAHGSPHLIRLITELRRVGARRIVLPPCPLCHRDAALTHPVEGRRVCKSCHKRAQPTKLCADCGRDRRIVARTAEGKPLCQSCYRHLALLYEECTRCHQLRFIIRRRGAQRLCGNCFRRPMAICGHCGRYAVCLGVAAGAPVCETCVAKKWPCAHCGKTLQIAAHAPDGRLCHTCWEKDPRSFRTCTGCGSLERLFHRGLCPRCALARRLDELVYDSDAVSRAELAALRQVLLATGSPASTLRWLAESAASRILTDIITGACPLTHDAIDAQLPRKASRHLRAILVTAGWLAPRDEHLADLQAWINQTLATVNSPEQRNLLRRFVTWHHLARLRRKLHGEFAERTQADAIRVSLRAAIGFLDWLHQQNLTLATCGQADVDRWISDGPSTHYRIRDFVHWSVAKRCAHHIKVPKYQQTSQTTPLDAERRWAMAHRLLDDHTLPAKDRVAGLFTLLYAQPATNIARLTTADVTASGGDTYIRFGATPLRLPEPVALLLDEHIRTRASRVNFGRGNESNWLFPSGTDPARPMSPGHLGRRLQQIGITSRPGRHAALLDIATQLPAAVIADLLGISTSAADGWVDRSGASWANYAAHLQRRAPLRPQ